MNGLTRNRCWCLCCECWSWHDDGGGGCSVESVPEADEVHLEWRRVPKDYLGGKSVGLRSRIEETQV